MVRDHRAFFFCATLFGRLAFSVANSRRACNAGNELGTRCGAD
jgi:hypothetical protein